MRDNAVEQSKNALLDRHDRLVSYLRLSITDRCNLNCIYCRPGPCRDLPRRELLSYEEMLRLVRIFAELGVRKVRVTGGEPFARQGAVDFIGRIKKIVGIKTVGVTTNGTLAFKHLGRLKKAGVTAVNFSLDTLFPERYGKITGSDLFQEVFSSIIEAIMLEMSVKINVVVLDTVNTDELLSLAGLAKTFPVEVRFIEPMPFDGRGEFKPSIWNAARLKEYLQEHLPDCIEFIRKENSTAQLFKAKGFQGVVGIIGGHSRNFCASCNKVRLTPQGILKNCLYDDGVLDLKKFLRRNACDEEIKEAIRLAVGMRMANGHAVEQERQKKNVRSMAAIGG